MQKLENPIVATWKLIIDPDERHRLAFIYIFLWFLIPTLYYSGFFHSTYHFYLWITPWSSPPELAGMEKRWFPAIKIFLPLGLEQLSILLAVGIWVLKEPDRRRDSIIRAWQVLMDSDNKSGDGGRKTALELLNNSNEDKRYPYFWLKYPREDLAFINISSLKQDKHNSKDQDQDQGENKKQIKESQHEFSVTTTNLFQVQLPKAILASAELTGVNLLNANLRGANLSLAVLNEANLRDANLENADLVRAFMIGTYLYSANLRNANLTDVDLSFANLENVDFKDATLIRANLNGAYIHQPKDITTKQLATARNWDKAIYFGDKIMKHRRIAYVPIEPFNSNIINTIKNDIEENNYPNTYKESQDP